MMDLFDLLADSRVHQLEELMVPGNFIVMSDDGFVYKQYTIMQATPGRWAFDDAKEAEGCTLVEVKMSVNAYPYPYYRVVPISRRCLSPDSPFYIYRVIARKTLRVIWEATGQDD